MHDFDFLEILSVGKSILGTPQEAWTLNGETELYSVD